MNCRPCIVCINCKEKTRNIIGKPYSKHSIAFIKTDKTFQQINLYLACIYVFMYLCIYGWLYLCIYVFMVGCISLSK